jgi:enterochelin esterase-like enzyme
LGSDGSPADRGAIIRAMNKYRLFFLLLIVAGTLVAAGCEPLVPAPTAEVIVITATPSPAPTLSATPTLTPTPNVTATPTPSPSPTAALCPETEGQIIAFDEFTSDIAGQNMPYRVYVPPCYFESQRRYPVVYLLHGAASDDTQWEDLGVVETLDRGLALNIYPPMILVMPYGGSLLPDDAYDEGSTLEDFLLQELIPRVERDFCVWTDRDHRAIGGISRGGFWALSTAFRNPEGFSVVGGHSAALDTGSTPPDYNPLDLALNAPFLDTLRVYLDNGANDSVRPELELLSNRLVQSQVPHEYVINPLGDHSDAYWTAHLADYLAFYAGSAAEGWPRDAGLLPSCLEPSP